MPRVDFYLITAGSFRDAQGFACQLLEKAYKLGHNIYVTVEDLALAAQLNDLLWTFRDISFVPHEIVTNQVNESIPIQIGTANNAPKRGDILLNLTSQMPHAAVEFARIIEIVPNDANLQAQARGRYKLYKQQECQLETHDLR